MKSRLLRFEAEGVLQVTNKRVVFRAAGKSITGNSIIQSEVPIEDVSGIGIYKGTYFSIKHFLIALLAFFVINPIFTAVLGIFSFVNSEIATAVQWICVVGSIGGIIKIPRKYVWNSVLGGVATVSTAMIAGGSLLDMVMGGGFGGYGYNNMRWMLFVTAVAFVYTIVAMFLYARRNTMSLSIGSKGGSSTPIYISGVTSFGFANSAAPKAIEAEPAEQTEELIKELGAMIIDIQKLGDYGIEKWMAE